MVKLEDIYRATDDGKQIILDVVPNATETKNFSYRTDDEHPSARLYPPRDGRKYWAIKDFGGNGEETLFSPIDVFMREKGISQNDFYVAVQMLGEIYGVGEQLDKSVNRPRIETRPANADENDGQHYFQTKDVITESEVKLWGPKVTAEHLKELGWAAVESITSVKEGKATVKYSNDQYPIFVQKNPYVDKHGNVCCFYKIYQPFCTDKQWRFYSIGSKPQDYIFGLDSLVRAFNLNGQVPIDEICICSGGSDGANCLSMGVQPVWLGSETQTLTPEMYSRLKKYAKVIYLCFDADDAGLEKARSIALQYLDIKVINLPQALLGSLHDNRGKACKDLKDYIKVRPSQYHFDTLLRQARQARFWDVIEEGCGDKARYKVVTSLNRLCHFLWLNGYAVMRDPVFKYARFLHINGIVVEEVVLSDIHHFLKDWMQEQGLSDMIIDKVMRSRDVASLLANNLTEVELDFSSATATSQWFYFQNCSVEVTKDNISRHEYRQMPRDKRYVWKHHIIPHNYVPQKPMFTIERKDDDMYSITVHSLASEVFCFLINASRIHWRKEMEFRFGGDLEAKADYARTHKFCIDGEGLTEAEIAEQMQSLVNKIFSFGYNLHRYKMGTRAWGTFCLDGHIGENDECNGRTGKSLYGKILSEFLTSVKIEAKSQNTTERQFLYAKVSLDTDLLFVDECHRHLDFEHFYERISGVFTVERKGFDQETIPFAQSPKILFATNFINRKRDASAKGRELPVVFSDYYHQRAKNNDYLEDRSVADDFGHTLIDDRYQGWEADIAFLMQCEQFYLSAVEGDRRILPPLDSIEKRQQKAAMGMSFEQWAEDYYQVGGGHLDIPEKLDDIYMNYRKDAQSHAVDTDVFVKKLHEYCNYAEHISVFNPKDITGKDKDGQRWRKHGTNGQVRYIYVRSAAEAAQMAEDAKPQSLPAQQELNFDPFAAAADIEDDDAEAPF